MPLKDADGMANSAESDQTAPFWSSLIWVCTVCLDLAQYLAFLQYAS